MATINSTVEPADVSKTFNELITRLCDVRDVASALENGGAPMIDNQALARFVRMDIDGIGQTLEKIMFGMNMIPDDQASGIFVDDYDEWRRERESSPNNQGIDLKATNAAPQSFHLQE